MVRELEAVFENGLLRPLEPLSLAEKQRVHVTITDLPAPDPHSERIDKVAIEEFEVIPPIAVGEAEFFAERTFRELAEKQGAKPLTDPKMLQGVFSETDNLDEFLEEIYQGRT